MTILNWILLPLFKVVQLFNRQCMVDMDAVMTLLVPAKVLCNMWSYDFYDITLFTDKRRRHMINRVYLVVLIDYGEIIH